MVEKNIAALSVELGIAARDLPALAYVVELEAMCSWQRRAALEQIAARIGLSSDAARLILNSVTERVEALASAHALLKALIPHESAVRALLDNSGDASCSSGLKRASNG